MNVLASIAEAVGSPPLTAAPLFADVTDAIDHALSLPDEVIFERAVEGVPDDAVAELQRVEAERCRRSLATFARAAWPRVGVHGGRPMDWSWHHEAICNHVQALYEDLARAHNDPDHVMQVQNVVINVPPRSGKTMLVAVIAQVWAWVRWPWIKFRCVSANPRVSDDTSRNARDLIGTEWFQGMFIPAWHIRADVDAVRLFRNTEGGERRSSSFESGVTGEGSDVIQVDDPHDAKDVESETKRLSVLSKYDKALHSRVLHERACLRILIMQRLHEGDLAGHLLAQGGWEHIKIPTEREIKNPCKCSSCKRGDTWLGWRDPRCTEGEILHATRFTPEWVAAEKIRLGSYSYAGQHEQNPAPSEGGRFKWKFWRFYKKDGDPDIGDRPDKCYQGRARVLPTRFDRIVISVDCAFKDGPTNDRVAMFVIGTHGADRYVLDRRVGRYAFGKTKTIFQELADLWPLAFAKYVEDKANGSAVIDDLGSTIGGIIAVNPEGGKEARASTLEPSVEAGNWFLPDGVPWLDDFVGEFAVFPNGTHDDQVDAVSQASIKFVSSSGAMRTQMLSC